MKGAHRIIRSRPRLRSMPIDERTTEQRLGRMAAKGRSLPSPAFDPIRVKLQSLPIDERAKLIAEMFQIIAGEFAAMVLEHVEPPKRANGKGKR